MQEIETYEQLCEFILHTKDLRYLERRWGPRAKTRTKKGFEKRGDIGLVAQKRRWKEIVSVMCQSFPRISNTFGGLLRIDAAIDSHFSRNYIQQRMEWVVLRDYGTDICAFADELIRHDPSSYTLRMFVRHYLYRHRDVIDLDWTISDLVYFTNAVDHWDIYMAAAEFIAYQVVEHGFYLTNRDREALSQSSNKNLSDSAIARIVLFTQERKFKRGW